MIKWNLNKEIYEIIEKKNWYHQDSLSLEYKEVHYFDIIHVYSSITQIYIC